MNAPAAPASPPLRQHHAGRPKPSGRRAPRARARRLSLLIPGSPLYRLHVAFLVASGVLALGVLVLLDMLGPLFRRVTIKPKAPAL